MEEDRTFYQEAQATLRGYDQKLWLIPGLFFIAVGFIFENIIFKTQLNLEELLRNAIILFMGSLFLLILILLNNKAHVFHISIQKKINEFDEEYNNKEDVRIDRIPLTSMTIQELNLRMNILEKQFLESEGTKGANFTCIQKVLARVKVSSWIRRIMIMIFSITAVSCISCFILFIYSFT